MRQGLTIGEFATLTHLSVRTLRRYHEAGLLEPATVDPFTGYRYYSAEQIPTAQVIHRLRELDVPLAEVKSILAADDPQRRADLIAGHLRRLEAELDRTRAAVVSLRRLLRPDPADLRVELRSVPARTVAAVTGQVALEDSIRWYDAAMAELDAAFRRPSAPDPRRPLRQRAVHRRRRDDDRLPAGPQPRALRPDRGRRAAAGRPRRRRPRRAARRHRRHLRPPRRLGGRARPGGRRADPRDLPGRPPRHRGPRPSGVPRSAGRSSGSPR